MGPRIRESFVVTGGPVHAHQLTQCERGWHQGRRIRVEQVGEFLRASALGHFDDPLEARRFDRDDREPPCKDLPRRFELEEGFAVIVEDGVEWGRQDDAVVGDAASVGSASDTPLCGGFAVRQVASERDVDFAS